MVQEEGRGKRRFLEKMGDWIKKQGCIPVGNLGRS